MKRLHSLTIVFVIICCFGGSAWALDIDVNWLYNSDTPGWGVTAFADIQAAIDSAPEFSNIYVAAGCYFGKIVVDKSLNIEGDGSDSTFIQCLFDGSTVWINEPLVNFSGFFVYTNEGDPNSAIYVSGTHSCTISDCFVMAPDIGVKILSCRGIKVDSVVVQTDTSDNLSAGIYALFSDSTTIKNCTTSASWGIWLDSSDYCRADRNSCNGGIIGIQQHTSEGNQITNNICCNNSEFGIYITSGQFTAVSVGNRIEFNNCHYNGTGIILSGWCQKDTVIGNRCFYNLAYGIEIGAGSHDNIIKRNIIKYSENYGLYISYHSLPSWVIHDNLILCNRFIRNNDGACQGSDSGEDNLWDNGSAGNFWDDHTTPDGDDDGIVDVPYELDGTADALDNYPLAS